MNIPYILIVAAIGLYSIYQARQNRIRLRNIAGELYDLANLLPILQHEEWIVCAMNGFDQETDEHGGDGRFEYLALSRTGKADELGAISNVAVRRILCDIGSEPGDRVRLWTNRELASRPSELLASLQCTVLERAAVPA